MPSIARIAGSCSATAEVTQPASRIARCVSAARRQTVALALGASPCTAAATTALTARFETSAVSVELRSAKQEETVTMASRRFFTTALLVEVASISSSVFMISKSRQYPSRSSNRCDNTRSQKT